MNEKVDVKELEKYNITTSVKMDAKDVEKMLSMNIQDWNFPLNPLSLTKLKLYNSLYTAPIMSSHIVYCNVDDKPKKKEPSMTSEKLKFAVDNKLNVLLIGGHGVGKTMRVRGLWDSLNINYGYFHCPTLDPYIDLIGVPVNQDGKLVFIKPEHRNWAEIEFILFDEPNRAHKKIVNTLYELIQLKSIQGTSLPKLKGVWAAMNPDKGEQEYNVEVMDQSFLDRFHLHFYVPCELDEEFFTKKLKKEMFIEVNKWWRAIPENVREKHASPRRIEYALDVFNFGGDISDVLPSSTNPDCLKQILSGKQVEPKPITDTNESKTLLDNPTTYIDQNGITAFLDNLKKVPQEILQSQFPYTKGDPVKQNQDKSKIKGFLSAITLHPQFKSFGSPPNISIENSLLEAINNNISLLVQFSWQQNISTSTKQKALDIITQKAPALARKLVAQNSMRNYAQMNPVGQIPANQPQGIIMPPHNSYNAEDNF